MPADFFEKTFKSLQMPVIVCENTDGYPIVLANTSARLLCNPLLTIDKLKQKKENESLDDFMTFQNKQTRDTFLDSLKKIGSLTGYKASLLTAEDEPFTVYLSSNIVSIYDVEYFVIYIKEGEDGGFSEADVDNTITSAFQIAYQTNDIDEAINKILKLTCVFVNVSRAYIFEEISIYLTSNTYEWCNEGIEPAIQDLQELAKADYNYDEIIESGMYVTDDVRDLPDMDREILEGQGIKSLAIITMYDYEKPIGYVGFDDNTAYRKWSKVELRLLKGISNLLVSLVAKRNAMNQMKRGLELIEMIMDKQDALIYVEDIDTGKLIFVNNAFAKATNLKKETIIGHAFGEVMPEIESDKKQAFSIDKLVDDDGNYMDEIYTWDYQNINTGRWYLAKDTIFPWVDGRLVHLQNAVEITSKKEYERQLEYYASTDTLTGVHNRDWGFKFIGNNILNPNRDRNKGSSLVFIDVDGLKGTNDKYGHDTGDNMLIETVNIIKSNIRQTDMMFRWGGDEFVIILEGVGDDAEYVMEKINADMKEFNEKYNLPYDLSFSYGITDFDPEAGEDIDTIISRADKLMYKHKVEKKKQQEE